MIEHVIIPLPNGGHAIARVDPVANTVQVEAHDGSTVIRAASDPQSLTLLARVAAFDERTVDTLRAKYKDVEVLDSLPPLARLRTEYLLVEYHSDETTLVEFREYARERHAASRGDATWPEFWAALEDMAFGLATSV